MSEIYVPDSEGPGSTEGWKSGSAYQYPIGKPKDDPWDILFNNLYEQDEAQCKAWREEVKNLLIFAGLFSAVVTAFLIETYKTLLPNPNNTVINVLSVIASRVGNASNTDGFIPLPISDPFQADFTPAGTSVRVNIFFFLSLVLALSAALFGIVCMQWLTHHQRYSDTLSNEQKFALLNMRTDALRQWKVHGFFKTLPVLVQGALVLFFVGLTDFLWHIDRKVIIPVGIFIALTLLFLLLTTVIPTLQIFPLMYPSLQVNKKIPVECPYRSPQAAIFRRLITSNQIFFTLCAFIFSLLALVPCIIYRFYRQLVDAFKPSVGENAGSGNQWQNLELPTRDITDITNIIDVFLWPLATKSSNALCEVDLQLDLLKIWSDDSWLDFDTAWMRIRDTYFRCTCDPSSWLYQNREQDDPYMKHYYDTMHGIRRAIEDNFTFEDESIIFAAFHCAQALPIGKSMSSKPKEGLDPIPVLRTRNHYLSKIMRYAEKRSITHLSDIIEKPTVELLTDENACIFLDFITSRDSDYPDAAAHSVSKTFAEIQFRLMGYMYDKPHKLTDWNDPDSELKLLKLKKPLAIRPRKLYSMPEIDQEGQVFTFQWAFTLHSFFKIVSDKFSETQIQDTFVAHPIFQTYVSRFCDELWFQQYLGSLDPPTISETISILELIESSLQKLLHDEAYWTSEPSHCLFYCASYFFFGIYKANPNIPALLESTDAIHPLLKEYKQRVNVAPPVIKTGSWMAVGSRIWESDTGFDDLFSEDWWGFLENWNLSSRIQDNTKGLDYSPRYCRPEGPTTMPFPAENSGNTDDDSEKHQIYAIESELPEIQVKGNAASLTISEEEKTKETSGQGQVGMNADAAKNV